jgi:site-specific recombinase XerD
VKPSSVSPTGDWRPANAVATAAGATDGLASAAAYALAEKSENTRRAYRADLRAFVAWCDSVGRRAVPAEAETCAVYFAHLADSGLKVSSIQRRAAAIAYAHKLKGEASPLGLEAVKAVLRGVRRTVGVAATGKAPLTADLVAKVVRKLPDTLAGKRDRALIVLGFAAALRRSELVALHMRDVERNDGGVFLHIRRSKTDQEGQGAAIAVPAGGKLKPVEALDAWLAAADISDGPIFRSISRHGRIGPHGLCDRSAALVVKRACARARLDADAFAGHSLRAGFVTSALAAGADLFRVMDVTRHREVKTLRGYDRRSKAFKDHAGAKFL